MGRPGGHSGPFSSCLMVIHRPTWSSTRGVRWEGWQGEIGPNHWTCGVDGGPLRPITTPIYQMDSYQRAAATRKTGLYIYWGSLSGVLTSTGGFEDRVID